MTLSLDIETFGILPDDKNVRLFTLNSGNGTIVKLCEFGAAITSIQTSDRNGNIAEICLGYDNLDGYIKDNKNMGVTVGRYANRIANSKFTIKDKSYFLDANISPHQIHGGAKGFGRQIWQGLEFDHGNEIGVKFQRISPDGECGYPGNLVVSVTYSLNKSNRLAIDYHAVSDADTYVNMTNHAYFNLAGSRGDIKNHQIIIHSNKITPLSKDYLALGEIADINSTPFDLRRITKIGTGIDNPTEQMKMTGGYDINYIIGDDNLALKKAAFVKDPSSGRTLTVNTTQPCLQFYTGNNLQGAPSRNGGKLNKYSAFCLEAQDYPNGPNVDSFPSKILTKNDNYQQYIEYIFDYIA